MWWSKRESKVPADLDEARKIRDEAQADLAEVHAQAPYVARLTTRLVERRALNHFGDDLQISFTPKDKHA